MLYACWASVFSGMAVGVSTFVSTVIYGLQREVEKARRLLLPERAGTSALAFEREVQITSSLAHPNTVAIYDYGRTLDGTFYYAMEHLDGLDLQTLVERGGPPPPARVRHLLRQIAGALSEAHRRA